MSIKPSKTNPRAAAPESAQAPAPLFNGQSTGHEVAAPERESDFVCSLLDLLCIEKPEIQADRQRLDAALREHFGGDRYYVPARSPGQEPDTTARRVLALFNGRNPREVARKLGISRASVYRHLKQAGGVKGK